MIGFKASERTGSMFIWVAGWRFVGMDTGHVWDIWYLGYRNRHVPKGSIMRGTVDRDARSSRDGVFRLRSSDELFDYRYHCRLLGFHH